MKKILLTLLLPILIFANTYVDVPCSSIITIYKQLEGFNTKCAIDPNEYYLKQEFKNYNGVVTIDYIDGTDFTTTIDSNGFINTKILPDKHFYLVTPTYRSNKLKLSLLSDGSNSWKYFYLGTNRWRKYDRAPILIGSVTYPKVTHSEVQYPVYELTSRIIYGEGYPNHTEGSPFVGEVRIKGDNWEYIDVTDTNGTFTFKVTDRHEFVLAALDGTKWIEYPNKLSINIYDKLFEWRDAKWNILTSLDEARLSNNIVTLSDFLPDIHALDFKSISKTSFSFTPTDHTSADQGVHITVPTVKGITYQMTINVNKKVNIYFSNLQDNVYTSLRDKAGITGVNIDLKVNSFKALGSVSYFYFVPQEAGEFIMADISIVDVQVN